MRGATPRTWGPVRTVAATCAPVLDAGIEDADFVAAKVLGGEDLQMAEAVVDGVFAQAAGHEGKVAAGEQQAGDAAADHQQSHQRAAAIAKDIAKGKKQELSPWLPPA